MEDLENCLVHMGYGRARREAECWRVAQIGAPVPHGRAVARLRDPARSRVLRLWLDRLSEIERATPYRARRAARG